MSPVQQRGRFDKVMVPRGRNLLFTSCSDVPKNHWKTRSSSEDDDVVSLESLLDRGETKKFVFKKYHIVQIPFKDMDEGQVAVLSDQSEVDDLESGVSVVRKFLVEINDTVANTTRWIVATLVPTPENCRKYGSDSYSYINKETFEGIILYSNLDGSLRSVNSYGLRPIRKAQVISPSESSSYERVRYINVYGKGLSTRGGIDGGELEESICIGEKPDGDDGGGIGGGTGDDSPGRGTDPPVEGSHNGGGGGGGSAGGSTGPGQGGTDKDHQIDSSLIVVDRPRKDDDNEDDVVWYTVSLYGVGDGETIGSGRYSNRETSYVFCSAIPYTGSSFDRWTGDLRGRRNVVGFAINKDVTSTAYFVSAIGDPDDPNDPLNRPCFSEDSGVFNPLKEMVLASPGYSGIRGGTFGYVRSGDKKFHSGMDLLAPEGTPVYAMIDGVISRNNYTIGQPDKERREYPLGYSGDMNDAGNRVYVKGQFDGKDVMIGYWHLQAGTPLAINPRTGSIYKPGDEIFRGELLGYTGRTGNAYNVTNKHLHLVYKVKNSNGKYVYKNPEEIINGLVNWKDGDSSTKKILDGAIVEIDCDPEEILITL